MENLEEQVKLLQARIEDLEERLWDIFDYNNSLLSHAKWWDRHPGYLVDPRDALYFANHINAVLTGDEYNPPRDPALNSIHKES